MADQCSTESPAPEQGDGLLRRARLAVLRNVALSAVIALGCVLIVLLVFYRPLVYRIFPWVEPVDLEDELAPEEGIYNITYTQGGQTRQMLDVVDPTLRPDLYVTVEFTYACGCKGSFIPAFSGWMEKHYPEQAKAEYEKQICPKCRQQLEYLKQREEMEQGAGHVQDK